MARPNSRASAGWWLGLVAVAALTAFAFYAVLSVRFSGGEAYPNYSTLRADPLGARALYESLGRVPGVESVRNFELPEKLHGHPGETLMLLNVNVHAFNARGESFEGRPIAEWAIAGGRVVITLDPSKEFNGFEKTVDDAAREVREERKAEREKKKKEEAEKKSAADKDKKAAPEEKEKSKEPDKDEDSDDEEEKKGKKAQRKITAAEALKISASSREFIYTGKKGATLEVTPDFPLAPEDAPEWFSNVYLNADTAQDFKKLAEEILKSEKRSADFKEGKVANEKEEGKAAESAKPAKASETPKPSPWKLIAHRKDRSMIMERKMGAGSVVICTDSFFASNEALWNGPKTKFLSWLIGDAKRVVFDETHLGSNIGDAEGLMTLARRYHMHGLFIGGILLFLLYVWRNSMSLVPADASRDLGYWREDAVAGQSAAAGLEGLLRRGIPRKEMLERCFTTWDNTPAAAGTVPQEHRTKARSALSEMMGQGTKDLAYAYRRLRDLIHPTRK
jgi:hypothetical protein